MATYYKNPVTGATYDEDQAKLVQARNPSVQLTSMASQTAGKTTTSSNVSSGGTVNTPTYGGTIKNEDDGSQWYVSNGQQYRIADENNPYGGTLETDQQGGQYFTYDGQSYALGSGVGSVGVIGATQDPWEQLRNVIMSAYSQPTTGKNNLSYEDATKMAQDRYNPLYDQGANELQRQLKIQAEKSGITGPLLLSRLGEKLGSYEAQKQSAIASAAQDLMQVDQSNAEVEADRIYKENQSNISNLMSLFGMKQAYEESQADQELKNKNYELEQALSKYKEAEITGMYNGEPTLEAKQQTQKANDGTVIKSTTTQTKNEVINQATSEIYQMKQDGISADDVKDFIYKNYSKFGNNVTLSDLIKIVDTIYKAGAITNTNTTTKTANQLAGEAMLKDMQERPWYEWMYGVGTTK
ncbi:MAG: hypothetical protein CVU87_02705 [Firmicutes bacterium HGW-Firmicutes-12]|nr:MAG: hypothetical protein CVU87_02705 [Firmicutes bacterium HGW-Firmicutes-12]